MSLETGEPVTHFIARVGWSPRSLNCMTACGELVAQIRATRRAQDVTCLRCAATRVYLEAARRLARDHALYRDLLERAEANER